MQSIRRKSNQNIPPNQIFHKWVYLLIKEMYKEGKGASFRNLKAYKHYKNTFKSTNYIFSFTLKAKQIE